MWWAAAPLLRWTGGVVVLVAAVTWLRMDAASDARSACETARARESARQASAAEAALTAAEKRAAAAERHARHMAVAVDELSREIGAEAAPACILDDDFIGRVRRLR